MSFPKRPRIELPKLRAAANGSDCFMSLPGVCNYTPSTTVLAHRERGGMGMKGNDYNAMNMCSDCHDVFDQRVPSEFSRKQLNEFFDLQWPDQLEWWFRHGYLK